MCDDDSKLSQNEKLSLERISSAQESSPFRDLSYTCSAGGEAQRTHEAGRRRTLRIEPSNQLRPVSSCRLLGVKSPSGTSHSFMHDRRQNDFQSDDAELKYRKKTCIRRQVCRASHAPWASAFRVQHLSVRSVGISDPEERVEPSASVSRLPSSQLEHPRMFLRHSFSPSKTHLD